MGWLRSTLVGAAPPEAAACWQVGTHETIRAVGSQLGAFLRHTGRRILGDQLELTPPVPRLGSSDGRKGNLRDFAFCMPTQRTENSLQRTFACFEQETSTRELPGQAAREAVPPKRHLSVQKHKCSVRIRQKTQRKRMQRLRAQLKHAHARIRAGKAALCRLLTALSMKTQALQEAQEDKARLSGMRIPWPPLPYNAGTGPFYHPSAGDGAAPGQQPQQQQEQLQLEEEEAEAGIFEMDSEEEPPLLGQNANRQPYFPELDQYERLLEAYKSRCEWLEEQLYQVPTIQPSPARHWAAPPHQPAPQQQERAPRGPPPGFTPVLQQPSPPQQQHMEEVVASVFEMVMKEDPPLPVLIQEGPQQTGQTASGQPYVFGCDLYED